MVTPANYRLFVYGSLRSGLDNPMYEYISRYFHLIGEAKVKGRLYDMGSYPAGIAVEDEIFIIGELYEANEENGFSWAIGQLDDYEGVTIEPGEIQLYRREITQVHVNNEITHAWIYWYNGDTTGKPIISGGDLMQYLQLKK